MEVEQKDDKVYLEVARRAAEKTSTCARRHVGAVAVRKGSILTVAGNGAPDSIRRCTEYECIRVNERIASGKRLDLCKGVHAEARLIMTLLKEGVDTSEVDVYVTTRPCVACLKLLMEVNVRSIIWDEDYSNENDYFLKLVREYGDFNYKYPFKLVRAGVK